MDCLTALYKLISRSFSSRTDFSLLLFQFHVYIVLINSATMLDSPGLDFNGKKKKKKINTPSARLLLNAGTHGTAKHLYFD